MAQSIDDWSCNAQDGSWDGSGTEHEAVPFSEWHDGLAQYGYEPSSAESASPAARPSATGPQTAPPHAVDQRPTDKASRAPEPTRLHAAALHSAAVAALRADSLVTPREFQRAMACGNVQVTLEEAALALQSARPAPVAEVVAARLAPAVAAHAQKGVAGPSKLATSRMATPQSRHHPRQRTAWTPPGRHCPSCGATVNDQAGCRCS
jgi:hypothetical protein